MAIWFLISFVMIGIELILYLGLRWYQLGMVLTLLSGVMLSVLILWLTGEECYASTPVLPCVVGFVVLLLKEIQNNRSFATRYNPFCLESKISPRLRLLVLVLALVCSLVKFVLVLLR